MAVFHHVADSENYVADSENSAAQCMISLWFM